MTHLAGRHGAQLPRIAEPGDPGRESFPTFRLPTEVCAIGVTGCRWLGVCRQQLQPSPSTFPFCKIPGTQNFRLDHVALTLGSLMLKRPEGALQRPEVRGGKFYSFIYLFIQQCLHCMGGRTPVRSCSRRVLLRDLA